MDKQALPIGKAPGGQWVYFILLLTAKCIELPVRLTSFATPIFILPALFSLHGICSINLQHLHFQHHADIL